MGLDATAPRRLFVWVAVFTIVGAACTSESITVTFTAPPTRSTNTTLPSLIIDAATTSQIPSTAVAPVDDGSVFGVPRFDPATCGELGRAPDPGRYEIAFGWNGFLLGGDPVDGTLRCITPLENQERIVWGPLANQMLLGTARVTSATTYAGTVGPGAHFTRPTGRNLVWLEDGRLWKAALDGSNIRDISFLARHDTVAYHPAGVEIAVSGVDEAGVHGIWIARNDGTGAQRAVTSSAAMITMLTFGKSSGFLLSFVAEHDDGTTHLHELTLVDTEGVAPSNEFDASIALETDRRLASIFSNPWTDLVAVTEGSCDEPEGPRVRLAWGNEVSPSLRSIQSEVVGWVSEFELVIAVYPAGCDQPRELWVSAGGGAVDTPSGPVLLVRDAGVAAVRTLLPEPPKPLGEIDLDDFA